MRREWVIGAVALGLLAFVGSAARADEDYDKTLPAVAKNLANAKLTLDQGITAAAKQGKPISAQYEIDEDTHKFQLSVFVSKDDDLLEVIVDHNTGATKDPENVTGDDIKDAKNQRKAMQKATMSLADAAAAAAKANAGYTVVQIIPVTKGSDPVANIVLIKISDAKDVKKVTQKLD
jgi:hypothetical protein